MRELEELSPTVYRSLLFGIVLYFGLIIYANTIGEGTTALAAFIVAQIVFGIIALTVGMILYRQADRRLTPIWSAGVCFIVGGFVQFVYVVLPHPFLDVVSTIAVFVGIGLYIFAVWTQ